MHETLTRGAGLTLTIAYAGFIGWLFTAQPRTLTEAVGGVAAGVGAYSVDARSFEDGLAFFYNDQFVEARAAFARADPALRDARTQFYIAYSYYRQGWYRTHRDDALYREGVVAVDRAIALAPGRRLIVDDENLGMRSADELKAELEAGLRRDLSDFNPLRLLETRK
ncbi:MAG TPA: hypothetical protein VMO26_18565 [Vicinamibacterales bacterium]|nr:hypothetical protein [Vicinamibacterales bacterium]